MSGDKTEPEDKVEAIPLEEVLDELGMTEEEFASRFGDTPLERPGLEGMRRNFRAAFGSAG